MSKRFVSIWFPYLATDWFSLKKPELKTIPFVLTEPSHGRLLIVAANPVAKKAGISTGMIAADARALLPGLEVVDNKAGLTDQLLQRIAEWLIRFTPSVAVDPPNGIILDASGCSHLWGGDQAYLDDLLHKLAKRGYQARGAMADTIGCAWAKARFATRSFLVDKDQHYQSLLPLPVAALRLDPFITERLNKLGLKQIKDLIPISPVALRRRFGESLVHRLHQALGYEDETIHPIFPPEPYQERLPSFEPIHTLTGIEIALQRLLDQLCERLRAEGKGIRTAYFRGYRIDGKALGVQISTSRSSCEVDHLFHLFGLKLSTLEPGPGIELFVLEATKVEDYNPGQTTIWQGSGKLSDKAIAEFLDRLTNKNPDILIERFIPAEHHLPEKSVTAIQSLEEQSDLTWRSDTVRPIQLLSTPELIEVTAPIPDYPPLNFRYQGQLHKVVKADGPERIEQEWWISDGEHRDYYAVEDEEGQRYWLFRAGHYKAEKKVCWYLHGFFA